MREALKGLWSEEGDKNTFWEFFQEASSNEAFIGRDGLKLAKPRGKCTFKKYSRLGQLIRFHMNESICFKLLQLADNTIIQCKTSRNTLLSLKGILRGFKLISGLCVNLEKEYFNWNKYQGIFYLICIIILVLQQTLYHLLFSWDPSRGWS